MEQQALFYTFPTERLIQVIRTSDDIARDVIEALGIRIRHPERSEKNDVGESVMETLRSLIPTYFSPNRIYVDGIDTICQYINRKSVETSGEYHSELLASKKWGIFNPWVTGNPDEFVIANMIWSNYYIEQSIPCMLGETKIDLDHKEDLHMIAWESIRDRPITESIIQRSYDVWGLEGSLAVSEVKRIIDICEYAVKQQEELIIDVHEYPVVEQWESPSSSNEDEVEQEWADPRSR